MEEKLTPRHSVEEILSVHGVRLTAIRILVYKTMENFKDTFSLADLEDALETVDRSTIFRVIRTFDEHQLLHEIQDGSGRAKYCLCHGTHAQGDIQSLHCHFYCTKCHKTFCLTDAHIPLVSLPKGFEADSAEYIIKGLCPECAQK